MEGFREGYKFFSEHASEFLGIDSGDQYVTSVNGEIKKLVESLAKFKGKGSKIDTLKGDVAEFWHAGTFNIKAAVKESDHRMKVPRSRGLASVDVQPENFEGENFGLKYYKDGPASAKAQAKSLFEYYKEKGKEDTFEEFLQKRGYEDDSVMNDPIYRGQIRIIPSEQLKAAEKWLNDKINKESPGRPEQVERYKETLKMLRTKLSDSNGVESIELSEEEARKLAIMARDDNIDLEELHLTTEELIGFGDIMKSAMKAGLTAAMISVVLKAGPEIAKAIKYLIENGDIDEDEYKKIGIAAVKGAPEGFIRGTLAAAITAACQSGHLGESLKTSVDPSIVGAVTVLAMSTMKNAYAVSVGKMTRHEMADELIKTMFTSTCALVLGNVGQGIIQVPYLGYMIGSFAGSLIGSFAYTAAYRPAITFCIDTGFTMFRLVDQDYELPDDVIQDIGVDVFTYDKFDYGHHEPDKFEFKTFEPNSFEPEELEMTFLRRGVIGINTVGYLPA